jgi:hypothetical protein
MCGFWVLRTILQFVWLRIDHPVVHVLTSMFMAGVGLFAWPLLE